MTVASDSSFPESVSVVGVVDVDGDKRHPVEVFGGNMLDMCILILCSLLNPFLRPRWRGAQADAKNAYLGGD